MPASARPERCNGESSLQQAYNHRVERKAAVHRAKRRGAGSETVGATKRRANSPGETFSAQANPQPAQIVGGSRRRGEHEEVRSAGAGSACTGHLKHNDGPVRHVCNGRLDRGDSLHAYRRPRAAIESKLSIPAGGPPCPRGEQRDTARRLDASSDAGADHGAAERGERQRLDGPVVCDSNREHLAKDIHRARSPRCPVVTLSRHDADMGRA